MTDNPTVAATARDVRSAGGKYIGIAKELAAAAAEVADAESAHRVACNATGTPVDGPWVRELAADVALGALSSLRPCVPFVSELSAARSAEALEHFGEPVKERKAKGFGFDH